MSKEKPIFHYQHQSLENIHSEVREKLAQKITDILEVTNPLCESLYKFYSSNLCKKPPSPNTLLHKPDLESVEAYAKTL